MPGSDSIVGSGQLLSEDNYLRKIERTCIPEDPQMVNNYMRQQLKDTRPDKPFFESDLPRRNNYSRDRLNLRHSGRRVKAEPWLPDGTFLDHVFTEKDPRGIALGPDMKKHKEQQFARRKYINFYNDSHHHIPESGIHPSQMVMNIKGQFYNVKNRMNIFSTSQLGRHNGGTANLKRTSTAACVQQSDEKMPSLTEEKCQNRNRTSEISREMPIGWRRTTDHQFKVAKYGQNRKNLDIEKQNLYKNRSGSKIEHDIYLSYEDINIPRNLVMKISDLLYQKKQNIENGKFLNFATAWSQNNRSYKLSWEDLKHTGILDSATTPANVEIASNKHLPMTNKGLHLQQDTKKIKKSIVDPEVIEFMTMINKYLSPGEKQKIRQNIVESANREKFDIIQANKGDGSVRLNDKQVQNKWNSRSEFEKGESARLMNYSRVSSGIGIDVNNINYEEYKQKSAILDPRTIALGAPGLMSADKLSGAIQFDNNTGPEHCGSQIVGPLGSKYTREYHDGEPYQNEVEEIMASTHRK
jgi:hypothetical protein